MHSDTCTLGGSIQPLVNSTACSGLVAGSSCVLTCPTGYTGSGSANVTCSLSGGAMDVTGFTCVLGMG